MHTGNRNSQSFYGWIVVGAAFCIQMVAWGTNVTFAIFFNPLLAEFGWTRAMLSGTYSFHTMLRGILGIVVGGLNDKFGPKIILIICGAFLGLGFLLMSQVTSIWQLYLFYGVMVSIGMSASFIPVATAVATWFVKRRGMATAIFLAGSSFGCMIMAPLSNSLIATYGWRSSYVIIGISAVVIITFAAQFVKPNPSHVGRIPQEADDEGVGNLLAAGITFQQAIRTIQFWILFSIILCGSFCHFTILVHLVSHAIDLGISPNNAATLLAIVTGLGVLGRIAIGVAADKIGNRSVFSMCFVLLSIDFIWMLMAKVYWMLCLFAIIFGLVASVSVVLSSPIVGELFGMISHSTILGAAMFAYTIGAATGPLLAGYIYDITGSYQLDIVTCASLSSIGIILTILLRPAITEDTNSSV